MKKFIVLLLVLGSILLLSSSALADDFVTECPTCGNPDLTWKGITHAETGQSIHQQNCAECDQLCGGYEFCTPIPNSANCLAPAICSVCNYYMVGSSSSDPNNHALMSSWKYYDSSTHYRYCIYHLNSYEFASHTGGSATCHSPATCTACNTEYGEKDASNHHTDASTWEWVVYNDKQHYRYCPDCCAADSYEYADHTPPVPASEVPCSDIVTCADCGMSMGTGSKHNLCDWMPFDGTQHRRLCISCGAAETYEYASHAPNTTADQVSCSQDVTCADCGLAMDRGSKHSICDWTHLNDTQHYRYCPDCWGTETLEYADHTPLAPASEVSCSEQVTCADCGFVMGRGSKHSICDWTHLNATQHYRHCEVCNTAETLEYANHTPLVPASELSCREQVTCADCGFAMGRGSKHSISDWMHLNATQHYRYCEGCNAAETYEYANHTPLVPASELSCSKNVTCADCGFVLGRGSKHSISDWMFQDIAQHYRYCEDCGTAETFEYASHYIGGACYGVCTVCNNPRACDPNGKHTLTDWMEDWYTNSDTQHIRYCQDCRLVLTLEYADHTSDTATCTSGAICTDCGIAYGEPHGQHLYHNWQPMGDGTHISACHYCGEKLTVVCTIFRTAEEMALPFAACPICGEYEGGVLPVLYAHDDDEALPYGTLVVRGSEAPVDGAMYAITVTGSYAGQVLELLKPVTVRISMTLENFRIISMQGTEIPFTLEDGVLTFETETAGLFLLVPAQ